MRNMVSCGVKYFSKKTLPLMLALLMVIVPISCAKLPTPAPPALPPEQPPAPTITLNPVEKYAKTLGLSEEAINEVKALGEDEVMDENEKAFLDILSRYSKSEQLKLVELAKDGKIDEREKATLALINKISHLTVSEEAMGNNITYILSGKGSEVEGVYNYLSSISEKALNEIMRLGLNDSVVKYIALVSSLTAKEFTKYALENKLCIQDRNLTSIETDFLPAPEDHKKQLFDSYILSLEKASPELAQEIKRLPDFEQLEIKDVEALEDVIALAPYKSVGEITFDSMLDEGIKDKRKYCIPIQALVWSLYDHDKEYLEAKPWETEIRWKGKPSDLLKFVKYIWVKSSESNNFASDRWREFDEVADRLNSPMFIATYMRDNFSYIADAYIFQPAEISFKIEGGACSDRGMFGLELLMRSGYDYNDFGTHKNNAAAILVAFEGSSSFDCTVRAKNWGHAVTLYIKDDLFYTIDMSMIKGPFDTIEDAASATYRDWETCELRNVNAVITKRIKRQG